MPVTEAISRTMPIIEPKEKEIWRYLGYRNEEPGQDIKDRIAHCVEALQRECTPKHVQREFSLEILPAETADAVPEGEKTDRTTPVIHLHDLAITSGSLAKNLQGCEKALIFAATLGHAPDRLIRRASVTHMSDAVIYQAVAAEMIEAYCDSLNDEWKASYGLRGWCLHPRFSPGYGDLSLSLQRDIIRLLDTPRRIGLTLTKSLIMLPSKSVTAIIGLEQRDPDRGSSEPNAHCASSRSGCASCALIDCLYRR